MDLDGPSGFTAADTTIRGNYIGLDVNGTAALANGAMNVDVAAATNPVIGGPSANDRNVLAGSTQAIFNDGQGGLAVGNDYIGMNAAGTAACRPSTARSSRTAMLRTDMLLRQPVRMQPGRGSPST